MTERPSPLRYALAFALVFVAMALPLFCELSVMLLFDPTSEQRLQEPPQRGLPEPAGLAWNAIVRTNVIRLGLIPPGPMLLLESVLACALLYGLLRLLNPTFRLTAGIGSGSRLLTRTYMHTPPLIKAFLIAAPLVIPMMFVTYGLVTGLPGVLGPATGLAVVGACVWFLFSRGGVAGDYDSGNYELPRDPAIIRDLLGRGALAGLVGVLAIVVGRTIDARALFIAWRAMGELGQGHWLQVAGLTLLPTAALGFALGGICAALAPGSVPARCRARTGAPFAMVLVGVWLFSGIVLPRTLAARFDYVPAKASLAVRLARKAGVPHSTDRSRTFTLLAAPNRALPVPVSEDSVPGVNAAPASARRVEVFLQRRGYRTALIDPAYKTLFDAACLRMDPDAGMRVLERVVRDAPDSSCVSLLLQQLAWSAATPEALRIADRLGSPDSFVYLERTAEAEMARLFARLGETGKAQAWLARAGVPESRYSDAIGDGAPLTDGVVTGRLSLDGRPVAGARVGLLRAGSGALPIASRTPVPPFRLRGVAAGATTDATSRFRLTHLTEGMYYLLIDLPVAATVKRAEGPGGIVLGSRIAKADVGEVSLHSR